MKPVRLWWPALALAGLLSGCVVAPYYPYYSSTGEGAVAVADVAPPAAYAEVPPPIPYAGAVWIGGYWGWRAHRHHWVSGYWDRPRPGYYWRPHRWQPVMGRWHLAAGGWARQH